MLGIFLFVIRELLLLDFKLVEVDVCGVEVKLEFIEEMEER